MNADIPLILPDSVNPLVTPMHDGKSDLDEDFLADSEDLRQAILETVGDEWFSAKNVMLGNRSPEEVIGTPDEPRVRDMLLSFLVGAHS